MTNKQLAQQFEHLTASLQVIDPKKYFFQIRSYQRVIQLLIDMPEQISEIYREKGDLEFIDGIGPAIESKIVELLETGKSEEIEHYTQMMPQGMFPLLDIAGIGAKKAHKLATTFGITNPETAIDELEQLAKDGKIRELENFGEKSEMDIIENISRLRNSVESMPLEKALPIAEELIAYLKESPETTEATPLGSLRRKKKEVGDIDVGISTPNFSLVKEHVKKYPKLSRILASGDNLLRILLRGNIQVDIKCSPPERWGAFIQHFTGSKDHNIKLREHALKQGKSLSEHGIKLINEEKRLVEFASEEAFYNDLGLKWIKPEKRVGKDEIEKARL